MIERVKMKKIVLFFVFSTLIGCAGKASSSVDLSDSNVVSDTLDTSDVSDLLETSDLKLLGLHGAVESLDDERGRHWEFSKEGNLTSPLDGMKRDSKGRLVSLTLDGIEMSYIWDEDGVVSSDNGGGMKNVYTYDDRGLLLSCYTEVDSWEMSVYKYNAFDDHGNWTERDRMYIGLSTEVSEGENPTYRGRETESRIIRY